MNAPDFETRLVLRNASGQESTGFAAGETVTFVLTIRNRSGAARTLTQPTTQTHDCAVYREADGKDAAVWRWSSGRVFGQALTGLPLAPGESRTFTVSWSAADDEGAPLRPGAYRAEGWVPAGAPGTRSLPIMFTIRPPVPEPSGDDPAAGRALTLEVEPRRLAPGTPVRLRVSGAGPRAALTGAFMGRPLHFLPGPGGDGWVAFSGVDLDDRPGPHRATVRAREPDGRDFERAVEIKVVPKEFPTERLTVSQEFVEPPPEVAERIAREAARLRALWGMATPQWLADGIAMRPLEGVKGRNFGRRRIFNDQPRSPHSGTDLSAPEGTPVAAAAGGRVALAEEHYFSGNLVVLDHGGGVYTLYAHLSRIDVQPGEIVRAGAPIGLVGATGRVTGAHLHWAARIGDARVDPTMLLPLMAGGRREDG